MKFKLDENLGTRTQRVFEAAGHDVQTVADEGLSGRADSDLYKVCLVEGRCLVTLDLDFADVTRFPPARGNGIVVIRVPRNPTIALLEQLARQVIAFLAQPHVALPGNLWIVEVGRIRIHQTPDPY